MKDTRNLYKGFGRGEYAVNGVNTVVYSAGTGQPVVYFHGGGTFHGIDFCRGWLDRFKVFCPFHPGFGESGDAPHFNSINDFVVHYQALFGKMGLEQFHLVGISLGGWLASEFALTCPDMVLKLVLAAPAGLRDPEFPPANFAVIAPEDIPSYLVTDLKVLEPYLPKTAEQAAAMASNAAREGQALARMAPAGPFNPELERKLPGLSVPTLILWGKGDRVLPSGLAKKWIKLLPDARLELIDDIGHLIFDESPRACSIAADFLS